jgi:hypothetical protein
MEVYKIAITVHVLYMLVFLGWLLRNYLFAPSKNIFLVQFFYLSILGLTVLSVFYPTLDDFGLYFLMLIPLSTALFWLVCLMLATFGNAYLKKFEDIKYDILVGLIPLIVAISAFVFLTFRLRIPGVN